MLSVRTVCEVPVFSDWCVYVYLSVQTRLLGAPVLLAGFAFTRTPLPSGLDCGISCFGDSWAPRLLEQRPSQLLRALLRGQGARPLLITWGYTAPAPGGQSCQADCCLFLENLNQTSQCSSWEVAQLSPAAGRNPSFSFSLLSLNLPSTPSLPSWPCFILFSSAWGSLKIGFLLDVDPALRILETLWILTCPSSYSEVCLRVTFL